MRVAHVVWPSAPTISCREAEDQTHADLVRVDSLLAAARPARCVLGRWAEGQQLAHAPEAGCSACCQRAPIHSLCLFRGLHRAKSAPAPVGSNLAAPPVPPGRPPARPLKTCSAYTSEILGTEVLEKSGMLAKQSLVVGFAADTSLRGGIGVGGQCLFKGESAIVVIVWLTDRTLFQLKTWRTRWVVLRDGKMYYFREPEDSRRSRRALGVIVLDDLVRVRRATTSDGLGRPHAMIITTPSVGAAIQLPCPLSIYSPPLSVYEPMAQQHNAAHTRF